MANDAAKQAAGLAAARLIENGMTVGLGTGSTAACFVDALAERVRTEGLQIVCVPTSRAAEQQAQREGLQVVTLTAATRPDMTVDGADEVDAAFHLIKGAGGALVQEKLVAVSSREMVVVADPSKVVDILGAFRLPVAVIPFGWETTHARLTAAFPGIPAVLRCREDGSAIVTDDGLLLIDLHFGPTIADPHALQAKLRTVVGVAEVGLFVSIAHRIVIGHADGTTTMHTRPAA
jgi:ribose 5-phosphate isomerase A